MSASPPPTDAPRRPPRTPRPAPVPRATSPRVTALAHRLGLTATADGTGEGAGARTGAGAEPGAYGAQVAGGTGAAAGVLQGGHRDAVAEFWREVEAAGTPLVEPDPAGDPDHAVVTFLWRGTPATRSVLVLPNKVIDPRTPTDNLMTHLPGTDVWHWSLRMRRDWRASYALCVDEAAAAAGEPVGGETASGESVGEAPVVAQAPAPVMEPAGTAVEPTPTVAVVEPAVTASPVAAVQPTAPRTAQGVPAPEPSDPGYLPWLRGQGRPDPRNPHALPRRWGGAPQSVVRLSNAPGEADWQPRADVPRGTVTLHTVRSAALGNERRVWVYTPATTSPTQPPAPAPAPAPTSGASATPAPAGPESATPLPVLVLFDGEMWQPELGVATLLDNLIADGRLPPLVALLPDALDSDTRWSELACNDRFVDFLTDDLLPWAAARWPLTTDPARTVLAGQSLGGLLATYAAVRAPHRFGNALSQSGSFWWPDGPAGQWLTSLVARTPADPAHPVRCWLSAGEQEWVLLPANRRLPEVLRAQGYAAQYREFNGGHDYLCWRTELADGLVDLLGTG